MLIILFGFGLYSVWIEMEPRLRVTKENIERKQSLEI